MIVTPVVAFYILIDWHRMIAEIDGWLPLDYRDSLRKIAREINHALGGLHSGTVDRLPVPGAVVRHRIDADRPRFRLPDRRIGRLLSFVPYVGSLTALVLSLGVALVQGWPSLKPFFMALAVVGVGQFLEGYVLSPKLVGESVGLHPVWLMFALLAFGQLFGFLGLLIAVPMAAAIGVVARHLIALYLTSPLYRGRSARGRPMISPPRQLTFRWPHSPSFAREDFLPAPSNREALSAIELWPNWAGRMLTLVGPEGAGKSHLGAIWAGASGAITLHGEALDDAKRRGLRHAHPRCCSMTQIAPRHRKRCFFTS